MIFEKVLLKGNLAARGNSIESTIYDDNFFSRDPSTKVVHPYAWKASSEYEESEATGGYYSVCLDNQFSRFSAKLVNLYITTFRYA